MLSDVRLSLIKDALSAVNVETLKQHRESAAIQACEAFFASIASPTDIIARGVKRIAGPAIDFALSGRPENCVTAIVELVLAMASESRGLRVQVERLHDQLMSSQCQTPKKVTGQMPGNERSASDSSALTSASLASEARRELDAERRRSASLSNELTMRNVAFANLEERLRAATAKIDSLKLSNTALDDRQHESLLDAIARRNLALNHSAALDAKLQDVQAELSHMKEAESWHFKRFDTMVDLFLEREQLLISFSCDPAFSSTRGAAAELLHALVRTRRQLLAATTR